MTALIESLPPKVKIWFANAAVGMITADGVVSESELEFLRETISFLENMEDINAIVGMVKNKERPVLQKLKTTPELAAKILMQLATVAITDDRLDEAEIEFFKYVGKKLGFDPLYCTDVMTWGKESIALTRKKRALLKRAEKAIIY